MTTVLGIASFTYQRAEAAPSPQQGGGVVPAQGIDTDVKAAGGAAAQFRVANGPLVIIQPVPASPGVSVALSLPAGSQAELSGRLGSAHLTEHLVFRSSSQYQHGGLLLELQNLGAECGASTRPESVTFWQLLPPEALEKVLAMQADRLAGLAVNSGEFNREKQQVINECQDLRFHPQRAAVEWLRHQLSPGVAWQQLSPDGHSADIKKLTLNDLRDFYEKHYRPENAVLTVSGKCEPLLLEAKLKPLSAVKVSQARAILPQKLRPLLCLLLHLQACPMRLIPMFPKAAVWP